MEEKTNKPEETGIVEEESCSCCAGCCFSVKDLKEKAEELDKPEVE